VNGGFFFFLVLPLFLGGGWSGVATGRMVKGMVNFMVVTKIIEFEGWNETQQFEFVVLHKTKAPLQKITLANSGMNSS
jgi:hypothetical protein